MPKLPRRVRVAAGLAFAGAAFVPAHLADNHYYEQRNEQFAVRCVDENDGFAEPCAQYEPYSLEAPQAVQPDENHQDIWLGIDTAIAAALGLVGIRLLVRRPQEF